MKTILSVNKMTHHQILSNISKHISLNENEKNFFISLLEEHCFPKKDYLLKQGQYCKNIYFVNEGATRAFYLNEKGKESTIMFAMKDWWVTDMFSFTNEQPAMLSIQAIEDTSTFQLSKTKFEKLLLEFPKFERFFRIIFQKAYIREQLRTIQNLSLPAEERYDNFTAKYPLLLNQITQKQIASYLGITPEFLSTMRAKKRNA